jgi:cation diffusion facilitator family transporter
METGGTSSGASPGGNGDRGRRIRRVLVQVLVLNLLVLAAKGVAWWSSGALSIAAEALHSSLDALNNVIALTFAAIAAREPDDDHPYGHQKFETLGALVVVGFLSITVFELLKGAVSRLVGGQPLEVEATPTAIVLVLLSAVASLLVSRWELVQGRRLDSHLLVADAAHTRADVYASGAVLVGLLFVRAGYPVADPLIAIGVAAVIAWTGWEILKATVPVLVDERAVEDRTIRRIAEATEGVRAAWGIRSRGRPGEVFAELTVSVDPSLDVADAHTIADRVEREVADALGAREVTVHVEPDPGDGGEGATEPGSTPAPPRPAP